jgi:hypothetical protein
MRKGRMASLALVAWWLVTTPANAHAVCRPSDPQAVAGPQVEVTLRYNSRVDPARSRLLLQYPGGEAWSLLAEGGDTPADLRTKATDLVPGTYELHWEVLSADGHLSQGKLPFIVIDT